MKAPCLLSCLAALFLVSCSTPQSAQRPTLQVEWGERLPVQVPKGNEHGSRKRPIGVTVVNSGGKCTMQVGTTNVFSVPTPSWVSPGFGSSTVSAVKRGDERGYDYGWIPATIPELAVLRHNQETYYLFKDRGIVILADGGINHARVLNPEVLDAAVRRQMRWEDKEQLLEHGGTEKAMRQLAEHRTMMYDHMPLVVLAPPALSEKQAAGDVHR